MFQHFDLIPVKGLQAYEMENWLVCKKKTKMRRIQNMMDWVSWVWFGLLNKMKQLWN